jgi:hypothetical protein
MKIFPFCLLFPGYPKQRTSRFLTGTGRKRSISGKENRAQGRVPKIQKGI